MTETVPRVQETPGGLLLFYRGKALYNPDNPRERAEALARESILPDSCLVVVPSPLLGYGLDILLAKLPETSRILCVETDQSLMRISLDHIPEFILNDPRLTFVRTDGIEAALSHTEKVFGLGRFRRVVTVSLSRGYALHPEFYRNIAAAAMTRIQTFWRNRMTSLHMGRLWIGNLFVNLAALPASLPISRLRFDRPVVVVGAGESLESHIPFLHAVRYKAALVAVDTALPALLSSGIRPDLIVAAEAQFANIGDFADLRDWSIPVAADIVSYPPILRRFTGKRYLFASRFADLAWFAREDVRGILPPFIPPLGSVGVMALHIASEALDRRYPIFLAGLDLSYTPGKTHARGSPSHTRFLMESGRLSFPRQFASWCGRPKTKALFKDGRREISDAVLESYRMGIAELAAARGNVFNLAGPGLDLGAPVITHDEAARAMEDACERPQTDKAHSSGERVWTAEAVEDFYKAALRELEGTAASPRSFTEEKLKDLDFLSLDFPSTATAEDLPRLCLPRIALYTRKIRLGLRELSNFRRS